MRPGEKGTFTSWPAFFAAASTAAQPPSTIRSASETFLPPRLRAVELLLDRFELRQHLGQFSRLVDFPVLLRRQADARAVGAAALVAAAEGRGRRPGGRHQLRDRQAGREDLGLQRGDVLLVDQRVIDGGNRVLPDQHFLRHQRAEVAGTRAHVAVGQLEPGAGEGVGELPSGSGGSGARSSRRPGPSAATGRPWSSSADASSTDRARPESCAPACTFFATH